MRYLLTLACEVILTFIVGYSTQDFFITGEVVIFSTLIIYNLWDELCNVLEEEK